MEGGEPVTQARWTFSRDAIRLLRPTRATMRQMFFVWVDTGQLPPGVKLKLTDWHAPAMTTAAIRAEIRSGKRPAAVGCPGVVSDYHRPSVTLCDYDAPASPPSIPTIAELARTLGLNPREIRQDRTRRGWHLIIQWSRRLQPAETIALQLLLGSDQRREMFNLSRVLAGGGKNKRWNLLFEAKL